MAFFLIVPSVMIVSIVLVHALAKRLGLRIYYTTLIATALLSFAAVYATSLIAPAVGRDFLLRLGLIISAGSLIAVLLNRFLLKRQREEEERFTEEVKAAYEAEKKKESLPAEEKLDLNESDDPFATSRYNESVDATTDDKADKPVKKKTRAEEIDELFATLTIDVESDKSSRADKTVATDKSRADKTVASDKSRADRTVAADKSRGDKTVAADKSRGDRTVAADKSRGDRTVAADKSRGDKTVASDKSRGDKTVAADKSRADKTVSIDKSRADKTVASDKSRGDKTVATDKSHGDRTVAADKSRTDKTVAADKSRGDKTVASDKSRGDKTVAADKSRGDKTVASDKSRGDKTVASDKSRGDKTVASDKTRGDKTVASDKSRGDKTVAADKSRGDKTVAADKSRTRAEEIDELFKSSGSAKEFPLEKVFQPLQEVKPEEADKPIKLEKKADPVDNFPLQEVFKPLQEVKPKEADKPVKPVAKTSRAELFPLQEVFTPLSTLNLNKIEQITQEEKNSPSKSDDDEKFNTLDEILDKAYSERAKGHVWQAIELYKKALDRYRSDEYAPFVAIDLGNLYKENALYSKAVKVYEDALTLPPVRRNAEIKKEFATNLEYLRVVRDVLTRHRATSTPFDKLPKEILQEVDTEFNKVLNTFGG